MKKTILLILTLGLALTLFACGGDTPRARATIGSGAITITGTTLNVRVGLIDPDEVLVDGTIHVTVTGPNTENQPVLDADVWFRGTRTFNFEDLTPNVAYTILVTATLADATRIDLLSRDFTTLAVGQAEDVPIMITTPAEFQAMTEHTAATYFALANDLDFTDIENEVMFTTNRFIHHFDGRGYTIKNYTLNGSGAHISIFGFMRDGSIRNLVLDNVIIDNTETPATVALYAGILVSRIDSINAVIDNVTIQNSKLNVRHNMRLQNDQWTFTATNRSLFAGALVGSAQGTITNIVIENTQVNVEMANLMHGLTAIAGTHIGGAIGLVESNRGREISNLDIDTEINVLINANRIGGESILNIGGVIGWHRGMQNHAAPIIAGVIASGSVKLTMNVNVDGTPPGAFWVRIGGVIGHIDSTQPIRDAVVTNNITVNYTENQDFGGSFHTGAIFGFTDQGPAAVVRVVSDGQTVVVNHERVTTLDLFSYERASVLPTEFNAFISNSTLTLNTVVMTSSFAVFTEDLNSFIQNEWILARL